MPYYGGVWRDDDYTYPQAMQRNSENIENINRWQNEVDKEVDAGRPNSTRAKNHRKAIERSYAENRDLHRHVINRKTGCWCFIAIPGAAALYGLYESVSYFI